MKTKDELPECPVATTVGLIGSKWKLLILRNLLVRSWRFNELKKNKAVGSICAQYYDKEGRAVKSEWNDHCIAMPLSQIRQNRMTVGVASGSDRVDAILGALRGNLINVLISDSETATEVLKRHESG